MHEASREPALFDTRVESLASASGSRWSWSPQSSPPYVSALRPVVRDCELLELLGAGAMGVVYKARQRSLNRLVAVKALRSPIGLEPAQLARMKAEVRALAQLRHPGVVQVYGVEACEEFPCFVMEYVEGGSLADALQDGPLEPRRSAELLRRVALAVDFAHQRGIVHRDLKPANILLTRGGFPKVADFSLAKQAREAATTGFLGGPTGSQTVLGTPGFMAPEQAAGDSHTAGPAADVFSLGAVLYAALAGRTPFAAPTPAEAMRRVMHCEPPALSAVGTPQDLETICRKCLEKNPHQRYRSAGELAEDLQRFLNHEPIVARPPNAVSRLAKWGRRNPALAAMLFSVASLLAILLATTFWHLHRLRREVNRANQYAEVARRRGSEVEALAVRLRRQLTQARAANRLMSEILTNTPARDDQQNPLRARLSVRVAEHLREDPDAIVRTRGAYLAIWSGLQFADRGQAAQTERCFQTALEILSHQLRIDPGNARHWKDKANLYVRWAVAEDKLGQPQTALRHTASELAVRQQIVARFPDDPQLRLSLGNSWLRLARRRAEQNQRQATRLAVRSGLRVLRELADRFPERTQFQRRWQSATRSHARYLKGVSQ